MTERAFIEETRRLFAERRDGFTTIEEMGDWIGQRLLDQSILYGDGSPVNRGLLPPLQQTTILPPSTMTRQQRRAADRKAKKI